MQTTAPCQLASPFPESDDQPGKETDGDNRGGDGPPGNRDVGAKGGSDRTLKGFTKGVVPNEGLALVLGPHRIVNFGGFGEVDDVAEPSLLALVPADSDRGQTEGLLEFDFSIEIDGEAIEADVEGAGEAFGGVGKVLDEFVFGQIHQGEHRVGRYLDGDGGLPASLGDLKVVEFELGFRVDQSRDLVAESLFAAGEGQGAARNHVFDRGPPGAVAFDPDFLTNIEAAAEKQAAEDREEGDGGSHGLAGGSALGSGLATEGSCKGGGVGQCSPRMERLIEPEIIDNLAPDHPMAVRSRRDLRMINFVMGNERWLRSEVGSHRDAAAKGIVELGAGGGELLGRLGRLGPATGYDLMPRPDHLASAVDWRQGDFWKCEEEIRGGILVANLFLHHLDESELARLGRIAERFEVLAFVEPHRSKDALWMGERLLPVVGEATKHDMMVSIRAGFTNGELPALLGLSSEWKVSERCTWRGGLRMLASRA